MVSLKQEANREKRLDQVGATASMLCAVHCALMPFLITLLPLLGLSFLADKRLEWGLVGASALIGISSLCLGYRRHRSRQAFAVLCVGLALLILGRVFEDRGIAYGVYIVVFGGVSVSVSHLINRRLCDSCVKCHHDHCA